MGSRCTFSARTDLGFRRLHREGRAGDRRLRLQVAGVHEGFERQEPATPGNDGVFSALVLTHDEGLQKAVRIDGCGQFVDALVEIGLADIALPGENLVEGDVVVSVMMMPLWFE